MIDSSLVILTAQQITKELGLAESELGKPDGLELLRERVAYVVAHLLEKDFEKLLNMLYIMDVNEEKIKQVILEQSDALVHYPIADLIIEREWKKVETRLFYKQDKLEDEESWE